MLTKSIYVPTLITYANVDMYKAKDIRIKLLPGCTVLCGCGFIVHSNGICTYCSVYQQPSLFPVLFPIQNTFTYTCNCVDCVHVLLVVETIRVGCCDICAATHSITKESFRLV